MGEPAIDIILRGGFTPARMPGLQTELIVDLSGVYTDAARTVPSVNDGDPIGGWPDLGSLGNHVSQGTAAARLTLKTGANGVNGRPVGLLDGVDDTLASPAFGVALAQPYTIYAVAKKRVNDSAQDVVVTGGPQLGFYPSSNEAYIWAGTSFVRKACTVTNWNILTGIYNGASSALYVNGGTPATGDAGGNAMTLVTLGKAGGGTEFDGNLYAVLIYSGAHDAGQRAKVQGYLSGRTGIVVA